MFFSADKKLAIIINLNKKTNNINFDNKQETLKKNTYLRGAVMMVFNLITKYFLF